MLGAALADAVGEQDRTIPMKIVVIGGSGLVVMALVVDLLPRRIVADARKLDHAGR